MSRIILTTIALLTGLSVTGCLGDPDLGVVSETISVRIPVERLLWEDAAAGCEDALTLDAQIHLCAGEPMLGALVDGAGHVLCVDAISTLQQERGDTAHGGANWDPTPTPLTPVPGTSFSYWPAR